MEAGGIELVEGSTKYRRTHPIVHRWRWPTAAPPVGYHDAETIRQTGTGCTRSSSRLLLYDVRPLRRRDRSQIPLPIRPGIAMNSMSPDAEAAVQTYLENKEDWSDVKPYAHIWSPPRRRFQIV